MDEKDEEEIQDDAALLNFAAVLAKAQELAIKAKREKQGEKKRP